MVLGSRRPPLPAPTDTSAFSSGDQASAIADDLTTDVSRVTDRTSYSVPEDGRPVTITTRKRGDKETALRRGANSSQTSLLIEYFEAGKSSSKDGEPNPHPSVRVRVTPRAVAANKGKQPANHNKVTSRNRNRVPSYTRRVSLTAKGNTGNSSEPDQTTISSQPDSRPPLEIEVRHNESEVSYSGQAYGRYIPPPSDISSMPPDSMLEEKPIVRSPGRQRSRSSLADADDEHIQAKLKAPSRRRSRSLSRERITQRVMEKLANQQDELASPSISSRRRERGERSSSKEQAFLDEKRSRRKSSKSYKDEDSVHSHERSTLSAGRKSDQQSVRSGTSTASINDAKLYHHVEDAIRRLILPEINAMKKGNRVDTGKSKVDRSSKDSTASSTATSRDGSKPRTLKTAGTVASSHEPKNTSRYDADEKAVYKERRSHRSNRDSISEKSHRRESGDSFSQGEKAYRKRSSSSKDKQRTKEALAVGAGATLLTAAALKRHDSQETVEKRDRRKKRSKSGSRSASVNEGAEAYTKKEKIPPLPMQSEIQSDLTRDSILSVDREQSESSKGVETPTRHNLAKVSGKRSISPSKTPTNKPAAIKDASRSRDIDYFGDVDRDSYKTRDSAVSPVQSAASYETERYSERSKEVKPSRKAIKDGLLTTRKSKDGYFVPEDDSLKTPLAEHLRSKRRPRGITLEKREEVIDPEILNQRRISRPSPGDSQRDSTDIDNRQQSMYTEDSYDGEYADKIATGQKIQKVDASPQLVNTPLAVESAVASLHEPSTVSAKSTHSSPIKASSFSYNRDRALDAEDHTSVEKDHVIPHNAYVEDDGDSPRQSDARSEDDQKVHLGVSAIPQPDDPMPEIGHGLNDETDTNPSIIQGPLDGGHKQSLWPYEPTPPPAGTADRDQARNLSGQDSYGNLPADGMYDGDASREAHFRPESAERGSLEHARFDTMKQPSRFGYADSPVQQDIDAANSHSYNRADGIPVSPANVRDEGYQSAAKTAPSPGAFTPEPHGKVSKFQGHGHVDDYDMDDEVDDPFVGAKRLRHLSGNSHGMASPLYDGATGKGIDRIQSKDVVALMDHLTVRDAQRNARDTEILVTLVRSAAEMRNSFEDMKKFMESQDRVVMGHAEKTAESTIHKLQGPRPQPLGSPRVPRRSLENVEDTPTRSRNVFKRALRGLSLKNSSDLTRIEDMLMQLLNDVESLKEGQGTQRQSTSHSNSMASYDNLQTNPDAGYEPEGQAGTSSTPTQSDYFSGPETIARHGNGMHSGYDGRRSSENRISTVIEGDEELAEREANEMDELENGERLLTPVQEVRKRTTAYYDSPQTYPAYPKTQNNYDSSAPRSSDRKSKHRSNSSSLFGIPKISRWSKTTASSAPDTARYSGRRERPSSEASRSGSQLDYYNDEYDLQEDDRLRSKQSLNGSQRNSFQSGRSPSPLVPETEFDDPKYQAHCNLLNLQHPQPRSGQFQRHQVQLETQARNFDKALSPDVEQDQWGSIPSLARHPVSQVPRYTDGARQLSPISSEGAYSAHRLSGDSANGPPRPPKIIDDGPLVPPKVPYLEEEENASPYGSGTQLAPIEEVRPSLETERSASDVSVPRKKLACFCCGANLISL